MRRENNKFAKPISYFFFFWKVIRQYGVILRVLTIEKHFPDLADT